MSASPCLYHPLDRDKQEIRLFRLIGKGTWAIAGELQTFELADAPIYKALSYAWGSDRIPRTIWINGLNVSVSRNLADFLQVLAKYEQQPWIWIDQLCIAQECVQEKNHQVRLMGEIYSNARDTLVWLGNNTHAGAVPTLIQQWETRENSRDRGPVHVPDADEALAVAAFQSLSYWTRHWVAQELALSKRRTFMLGEVQFERDSLGALGCEPYSAVRPSEKLVNFVDHFNESRASDQYYTFCAFAKDSRCRDPRDKVFGLQNLLPHSLRVEVNYDVSVWDVFVDTVARWHTYLKHQAGTAGDWRYFGKTYASYANDLRFLRDCDNLAVGMGLLDSHHRIKQSNPDPDFEQCISSMEENFVTPGWLDPGSVNVLYMVLVNVVLPGPDWIDVAHTFLLDRRLKYPKTDECQTDLDIFRTWMSGD